MLLQPVLSLLIAAAIVEAEYQFKAGVHHYKNLQHYARQFRSVSRDECCDACGTACDNRFIFCLREHRAPPSYTVLEERHCPLGRYSTNVIDPDNDDMNFVLGEPLYDGVPNPLIFTGSLWTGGVQLAIQVFDVDYDFLNPEDYVDAFYINLTIPVGFFSLQPQLYEGLHRNSELTLSFELSCSENYYGSECDIFCKERNDEMGHYTCSANGSLVCNEGYQNPLVNCTECTMSEEDCCANLCLNGGTCTKSEGGAYHCQCVEGYVGTNCEMETDECNPNPCLNGQCTDLVADYNCRCPAGFIGKNCTEPTAAAAVAQNGSTNTAAQAAVNTGFNVNTFGGVLVGLAAVVIILLAVVVTLQVAALRRARLERCKESTQEPNSRLTPEETEATFQIYNANN